MALYGAAFTIFNLDLFLGRDHHIEDLILHPHGLDPLLEVMADLVFIPGIAVDHVPGALFSARFAQLFGAWACRGKVPGLNRRARNAGG